MFGLLAMFTIVMMGLALIIAAENFVEFRGRRVKRLSRR